MPLTEDQRRDVRSLLRYVADLRTELRKDGYEIDRNLSRRLDAAVSRVKRILRDPG